MSAAQHMVALEKANEVRSRRVELRKKVQAEEVTVPEILSTDVPEWLEKVPTATIIHWIPRLKRSIVNDWLYRCPISELQELGLTTIRQRLFLARELRDWEERRAHERKKKARAKKNREKVAA